MIFIMIIFFWSDSLRLCVEIPGKINLYINLYLAPLKNYLL